MEDRIRIGVSRCLLGEQVRYDGGHKHNKYITQTLGPFFDFIGVCPEVEAGMPVPREAMRLVGDPLHPRLLTTHGGEDKTEQIERFCRQKVQELEGADLCGFIFKRESPTSGLYRVKVYTEKGMSTRDGQGFFARAMVDRFPLLPVEDEGRLTDAGLRENFIERVFFYHRWRQFMTREPGMSALIDFHTRHKLLYMAHSPQLTRELGRWLAHTSLGKNKDQALEQYFEQAMRLMGMKATVKKNVNVLMHLMGHFKKLLTADEKQELLSNIEDYHRHYVPLVVPLTLLKHYIRKFEDPYLQQQFYLNPHPAELMLRNHV